MSHEHAHVGGGAHRAGPAAGGAHASPGKHTQVERLAMPAAAHAAHAEHAHEHAEETAHASAAGAGGVNLKGLQDFVARHEGYVDHVYLDSLGNPTAGIGHLLPKGRYHVGQKISAAQITQWFQHDVAKAIAGARRDIGPAYDRLDEARKMVVIDMVFNLGEGGFGQFHATIHAIQTGHYAQAATHMLQSLWARQVGHRATEDAAIMRSGHLSGGGRAGHGHGDDGRSDGDGTGGVRAPDGDGGKHHGGDKPDGRWSPAPSLEEVKSGHATLHVGERGPAVKHVQRLLAVDVDGEFGPNTRAAVLELQHEHHMKRHDGAIDAHTLDVLTKHPLGTIEGESRSGAAQRARMLNIARGASQGRSPDGRCYYHVCQFLIQCGGYGKITNPYNQFPPGALPEAHDFADLMNGGAAKRFHIERLSIGNPYDAPSGSIVVVKAGSPGTHHPTAGDIAIADGHGAFYNGGMMSYGGRAGWEAAPRAKLLGCFVPT